MCHSMHVDRGQRTTREGQFSPSTIQDPGLNPGFQVGGRCLYPLRHLAGPRCLLLYQGTVVINRAVIQPLSSAYHDGGWGPQGENC